MGNQFKLGHHSIKVLFNNNLLWVNCRFYSFLSDIPTKIVRPSILLAVYSRLYTKSQTKLICGRIFMKEIKT